MDQYWVIGNPIAHSKSPLIHRLFAEQTQESLNYAPLLGEEGRFAQQVQEALQGSGKGMNVTLPFKEQAWALAEVRSQAAQAAGAVNTLWRDEQGRLCGDNTDGCGLVTDLIKNHHVMLSGQRVLLLGAGGAARGVVLPLLQAGVAELVIANRTLSKAETLVNDLAPFALNAARLHACAFSDLGEAPFDLIINATSASLQGALPAISTKLVSTHTLCYDMMYAAEPTAFCLWAQAQGGRALDGLGMLIEQAAEAFYIWRGVRPQTASVMQALRQAL